MDTLLQLLVSGIAQGCVYGLIALGFVLIYKATEMVNFAQGELMMLGAFVAVTFTQFLDWNYVPAVCATLLVMALIGVVLERVLLRPMIGEPAFAVLMLTIGLGFVLRAAAGAIWGQGTYSFRAPYSDEVLELGNVVLPVSNFAIIGGTFALCVVLFLFFRFSRVGIAMQAASQNQLAAFYVGIPVKRIVSITWALSAAIAGAAGILIAPTTQLDPLIGFLGIKAFAAAIVGGFGSMPGAIIGGLIIGVVEQLGNYAHVGFGEPSVFIALLIMLFLRPQGLIATLQRKKV